MVPMSRAVRDGVATRGMAALDSPRPPISVVVADHRRLVAECTAAALSAQPDLSVVAIAGTSAGAVDAARAARPDVVLSDVALPDADGVATARAIGEVSPGTRVLLVAGSAVDGLLSSAVEAGCAGVVPTSASLPTLADAVRRAHAGQPVFSPEDLTKLLHQMRSEPAVGADLTSREREVLQLLAEGVSTEALAEQLFISKHTARSHVRNILGKLGAHSKLEAVSIALRAGLVQVPQGA